MKAIKKNSEGLVSELFLILGACTAMKQLHDLIAEGKEVPETVSTMAGTLTTEIPLMVSLMIADLIKDKDEYLLSFPEAAMLNSWILLTAKHEAKEEEDE